MWHYRKLNLEVLTLEIHKMICASCAVELGFDRDFWFRTYYTLNIGVNECENCQRQLIYTEEDRKKFEDDEYATD